MPVAQTPDAGKPLVRLATLWRAQVDRPARRALTAILVTGAFATSHLARVGTPLARLSALSILLGLLAAALVVALRAKRAFQSDRGIIRRVLFSTDREWGRRALRAIGLVERSRAFPDESSPELAQLHFDRVLTRVTDERISERASVSARRWHFLGMTAGVIALVSVLPAPFRVVEGLDILFARGGEAPVPFDWLDDLLVAAHPPPYLHQPDSVRTGFARLSLPRGTIVSVRGRAVHEGRSLVLYDGVQEIPFVDDARGGLVARATLGESTQLRIGARFGGVLIPQSGVFDLLSIPDLAPLVTVEDAPRSVRLLEEPEVTLSYEAHDDHGLREIQLVLRAGTREERRVLAKLDDDVRSHRGAIRLHASDPFLKREHVPIEVLVEARDNDPITGPKWGRSAATTLIPPAVGEPEALRYAALTRARDAWVDLTAFRTETAVPKSRAERRAHGEEEAEQFERALQIVDEALGGSYGGLRVPRRTAMLARGQLRKLEDALAKELKRTSQATHDEHLRITEDVTLAFDGALRVQGARDAATVSRRLADVADDCAVGAEQARSPADRERGLARFDAAVEVLQSGGEQLRKLGALGADLGEIVENGLRRIVRTRESDDLFHAEHAARDLAARLRKPVPSFSGGGGGGVEAGTGASDSGEPGDSSDAEGEIARQQQDLEELARDHAAEMAEVEQALRDATDPAQLEAITDEARRRAEAVREVARSLRALYGEPGSAEASAATGREHAEAMAGALDRGSLADAVESGRNAMRSLEDAARKPSSRSPFGDAPMRDRAQGAQRELAPQLAWAEEALDELRKSASSAARERLRESAGREGKLADRAREVAERGQEGMAGLPEELLDLLRGAEASMREAQRALGDAQGERGLERQRSAQRLLEMARDDGEQGSEGEDRDEAPPSDARHARRGESESTDADFASKLPIPDAKEHKGPEAFRRRVLEGLGGSNDPRLREAIKRYAEGLLR